MESQPSPPAWGQTRPGGAGNGGVPSQPLDVALRALTVGRPRRPLASSSRLQLEGLAPGGDRRLPSCPEQLEQALWPGLGREKALPRVVQPAGRRCRDLPSNGKAEVPDSGRGRSPLHPSPHRALCHSAVKMPPIQIQMSLVWNSLNQGPLTKNTLIGWAKQPVEGKQACLGTEDAPHVPLGIKKNKSFCGLAGMRAAGHQG